MDGLVTLSALRQRSWLLETMASLSTTIDEAASELTKCLAGGGKVLLFGNGGSAAIAQHLAAEFVGRFRVDRSPYPAISLTTDTSVLTAVANDYGFEHVFARQIHALASDGDVVIGMSTSGKSPNVLAGIREAQLLGSQTIVLTGSGGSDLAQLAGLGFVVASHDAALIQEGHLTIGHILCEIVESQLQGGTPYRYHRDPIGSAIPSPPTALLSPRDVKALRSHWRMNGQKIAWTNGCFDLFHAGHVRLLVGARRLADVLLVGLNSDRSVEALKGPGRPIVPFERRAEMLSALQAVDWVVELDDMTPSKVLEELQPDVVVKGADYGPESGRFMPEVEVVHSYGGHFHFVPLVEGMSTTAIAEGVRPQRTP